MLQSIQLQQTRALNVMAKVTFIFKITYCKGQGHFHNEVPEAVAGHDDDAGLFLWAPSKIRFQVKV